MTDKIEAARAVLAALGVTAEDIAGAPPDELDGWIRNENKAGKKLHPFTVVQAKKDDRDPPGRDILAGNTNWDVIKWFRVVAEAYPDGGPTWVTCGDGPLPGRPTDRIIVRESGISGFFRLYRVSHGEASKFDLSGNWDSEGACCHEWRYEDASRGAGPAPDIDAMLPRRRWVPKRGEKYWWCDSLGSACHDEWGDDNIDRERAALGNVFLTREAAEDHAANIRAWVELRERSNHPMKAVTGCFIKVTGEENWVLPGVRFSTPAMRDAAVAHIGKARIDKLIRWIWGV